MNAECRYAQIWISVIAWTGVLLTTTYVARTSEVLGPSSWGYATLLSLLGCIAVMAESLSNHMVRFWIVMASPSTPLMKQSTPLLSRSLALVHSSMIATWSVLVRRERQRT